MLNSSNLLIPLQKSDETGNYTLMNLKSLQLALPFPINSVQRPPKLVLHFMIDETAFYIIFFQGLTLLIKISKINHEGTELESPQLLALSQSENLLQIYKEFDKQLELAGSSRQELLRSIYFILIIYLRKKYHLEGQQLTLPWNFEIESTQQNKALEYASKLALPYEQKKSIAYQKLLALDYDKKSARYSAQGISNEHPSRNLGVNSNTLPASIPLSYVPAAKISLKESNFVSMTRQLNSLGQENKFSIVPYNPIVIPALKKTQRKFSCDDKTLYENPMQASKLVITKNDNSENPVKILSASANPLLKLERVQLQNLIRKLTMEAPLLKKVEERDPARLMKLFSNVLQIHSQKLLSRTSQTPATEDSRNVKSQIPKYVVQKGLLALTYESPKFICYPTQTSPEAPVQPGTNRIEPAPAQSVTRKNVSITANRKCLTYQSKLAIGYQPRLALTYKPLLALTYIPVLAIGYQSDYVSPSAGILYHDDEYEIVTKHVINSQSIEDRVEIEDEEYIRSIIEVASCKDDIEEVDFEDEEYYSKDDVVYFTDKDLDEIDFEELICIGHGQEDDGEGLPPKPHFEDFIIVDAA